MARKLKYLDLFAGAGGLSEGFKRAGFEPLAHVESDRSACFTLRTRTAYHWLLYKDRAEFYSDYLCKKITRRDFYELIPKAQMNSVINIEINKQNLPSIFSKIDKLLGKRKLDLIIGGPPCQAYSIVGRSRDMNRMKGDHRNHLYTYYAEFLKKYHPKYFIFENVIGLLSAEDERGMSYFENMRKLFKKVGYETDYRVLSANEYGVLQNRKRIILFGSRGKSNGSYPEPKKWNPDVLVEEVFSDLPRLKADSGEIGPCKIKKYKKKYLYNALIRNDRFPVTMHQSRPNTKQDLEIYRIVVKKWNKYNKRLDYNDLPERLKTHKQRQSFSDRFKVVAANLPSSHTIVAHIAKDGHYYIHPDINQNRSITPREAARLQTFPDDFYFESSTEKPFRTPAFRQIGNAVPVLLSTKIAEKLMEVW